MTKRKAKVTLLILICAMITIVQKSPAQDLPTSAPSPAPFSAGNEELGGLQNAVNLFTGELALPFPLASLPGRGGLNISVGMSYSSAGVTELANTWNREAPTGILGLGWSMDMPKIVTDHKGTSGREDDDFYLQENGTVTRLIITDYNPRSTYHEYSTERHQL